MDYSNISNHIPVHIPFLKPHFHYYYTFSMSINLKQNCARLFIPLEELLFRAGIKPSLNFCNFIEAQRNIILNLLLINGERIIR